jgi:hypothetical protein
MVAVPRDSGKARRQANPSWQAGHCASAIWKFLLGFALAAVLLVSPLFWARTYEGIIVRIERVRTKPSVKKAYGYSKLAI